jgi:predicted transcriptional regulator YdeE
VEPKLVTKDEIKLVGIETRTTNQREADPAMAKIPGLWQRFFTEGIEERIPNKTDAGVRFGTYTNYESDHTGKYSLIAAAEVSSLADIPEGMTSLTISPGKYLVFPVEGEMPMALVETWGYIWNYFGNGSDYKRAYTADFERYHDPNDMAKVDVYIAVI